jgi:hypothetical protein
MENNKCLKYGSDELVCVPTVSGDQPHIAAGGTGLRQVPAIRYVRTRCGFIEQGVNDPRDPDCLKEEYGVTAAPR